MFAVLVDPGTYPRWLVGAKKIRSVADDWPAPGSSFTHTVGFGPLEISDRTMERLRRLGEKHDPAVTQ